MSKKQSISTVTRNDMPETAEQEDIELWPSLEVKLKAEREQLELEIAIIFSTSHHFHRTWLTICRWLEYRAYEFLRINRKDQADAIKAVLEDLKKIANSKRKVRI